ncbi:MAG: hypothetical protein K2N38_11000 [Oscillospiraceae bacterium]|nr:hypothetical protein [Oscillospiraceae bacterium]
MNKKERRAAIMRIISENEVETQNELRELLEREGITVAQATLSRDIRELNIRKSVSDDEVSRYFSGVGSGSIGYSSIFAQSVISMDYAQNMVVLKCHAGLANAACKVVDEQEFGSVVGTIAGDDTVFIVTRSENHAVQLIVQLARLTDKD